MRGCATVVSNREAVHDSPVLATDSEASPTSSEGNDHTPTTYGAHSSGDRLPETIITEWTADECADFVASLGLSQYGDPFLGRPLRSLRADSSMDLQVQKMRLLVKHWWRYNMTI